MSVKLDIHDVLIKPLVTEKTYLIAEENKYSFEVHRYADKSAIKKAVEEIFSVKVKKVNVMNYKGKPKKRGVFVGKSRSWRKAIVSLEEGYRIKELEGQQ